MERMTARDPEGNAYFPECFKEPCGGGGCTKDHCEFLDSVCEKLAGYEEQDEQAEKQLAESEAARAELGKRLAAAEKELHEAKSEFDVDTAELRRQLANTQRELEIANRNAEILAAELLDIRVCLDRKADYVKMKFGYSSQLSHEALQKAVWYTARRIVDEDRKMRGQRGEEDSGGKSMEQYFRSCGIYGVPKGEAEQNYLTRTLSGSMEKMSMRACMVMGRVCRRVLERMEGEQK